MVPIHSPLGWWTECKNEHVTLDWLLHISQVIWWWILQFAWLVINFLKRPFFSWATNEGTLTSKRCSKYDHQLSLHNGSIEQWIYGQEILEHFSSRRVLNSPYQVNWLSARAQPLARNKSLSQRFWRGSLVSRISYPDHSRANELGRELHVFMANSSVSSPVAHF